MAIVALKCPQCKGNLQLDSDREFGFCEYCGTKIMIQEEMVNIVNNYSGQQIINNTYNGTTNIVNNHPNPLTESFKRKYADHDTPDLSIGRYEGPMKDGKPHGVGKFTWNDGTTYEGEFVNGIIEGNGKKIWKDQSYEGQFLNNLPEGQGHSSGIDGLNQKWEHEGAYHLGKLHGKGMMKWSDGDMYVGDFADGVRSGIGCLLSSDSETFSSWKQNRMDGETRIIWFNPGPNSAYMYEGQTYEGQFSRHGVMYFSDVT